MNDNKDNKGGNKGDTSKRGFASMPEDKQKEIARQGGIEAHKQGKAHEFKPGSQEAKDAGRKGGQSRQSGNDNNDDR